MGPDLGDATFGENAQFKHGRGLGAFKQKQEITIQMQCAKGTFSQAPFFFSSLRKHLQEEAPGKKWQSGRHNQPKTIIFVLCVNLRSCGLPSPPNYSLDFARTRTRTRTRKIQEKEEEQEQEHKKNTKRTRENSK
jgi:hypothetical protein